MHALFRPVRHGVGCVKAPGGTGKQQSLWVPVQGRRVQVKRTPKPALAVLAPTDNRPGSGSGKGACACTGARDKRRRQCTRHVRMHERLLDHGDVARVLLPRRRPGHGHGRVRHELRVLRVVAWEIRCCGGRVGGQRSIRARAHGSAD